MGSLVMTSTHAPDVGLQHPYPHRIMVDSDQYESDRRRASAVTPHTAHDATSSDTTTPSTATASRPRQPYHPHYASQQAQGLDQPQPGFRPLPGEEADGGHADPSPSSPRLLPTYRSARSLAGSEATSPSRIKVRDLSHIQSFASEEYLSRRLTRRTASSFCESGRQYEISSMPVTDIIEMVAGLLTKITTTNDRQHEHIHRPIHPPDDHSSMHPRASCVLAFHGKNVPSITILSYLSRIHKYCPATYEVFLSLLVYFDRMTELVNATLLQSMERAATEPASPGPNPTATTTATSPTSTTTANTPSPPSASPSTADTTTSTPTPSTTTTATPVAVATTTSTRPQSPAQSMRSDGATNVRTPSQIPSTPSGMGAPDPISQFFVVDSYNIHRLIIAGVTCASKFFSDVFYTNSRYAKVGGLPLVELNHLELQFLILNDFRLSIPVEELEAYGTMLVEFYAREIVAQQQQQQQLQQQQQQQQQHSQHPSSTLTSPISPHPSEVMYMRESSSRDPQN